MVEEYLKWQEFESRLVQAFSPATAINRKDFFRGRPAALRRVIDAVNQPGQHVVIYGERGVGKTSLANVFSAFLEPLPSDAFGTAKVNCFRQSTYSDVWTALFKNLGIPEPAIDDSDSWEAVDPSWVFEHLPRNRKLILVIDEFDRTEDSEIDEKLADTIKALSDYEVDTTLVLVGVADNVDELIAEHRSIDRCLLQVHLERMEFSELLEIVQGGVTSAEMTISDAAAQQICILSLGLPHYTHALGLAAGRASIDARRTNIDVIDVDEAVNALLSVCYPLFLVFPGQCRLASRAGWWSR